MTPYKDAINPIFGSTNAGLYNYYIYDLLDYLVEDNEPISLEDHVLITEFLNKKTEMNTSIQLTVKHIKRKMNIPGLLKDEFNCDSIRIIY